MSQLHTKCVFLNELFLSWVPPETNPEKKNLEVNSLLEVIPGSTHLFKCRKVDRKWREDNRGYVIKQVTTLVNWI